VDHCAARESERRPHAKKNLGEERMAQSSKSQDQKCQRVVENQIARGRNLAGNGAHSWQAEMLSGKRNSLPQTSIGGKSQPAEKIKKSLGTGHTTKSNCDEENQHYTQTAVDLKSQWEELNTNQSTRSCSHDRAAIRSRGKRN
jgi:hypothetical protein